MKDEKVIFDFSRDEILSILKQNEYHSPEQSDSEDKYRTRFSDKKNFYTSIIIRGAQRWYILLLLCALL